MLSELPIDLEKVSKENRDREILRVGMIAELDAVNLYEQLAAMAERKEVKAALLDIAKEEKTHMGEFQALLPPILPSLFSPSSSPFWFCSNYVISLKL